VTDTLAPPQPSATRQRVLLLGAIAFTVLAWASAFVVIRGVAPEVGGGALALGRLLVGVVALGILVAVQRRWVWPTGSDWVRLVIYGVGWFGAYNVTLNLAEHTLDAGTTAMIVNIGPILIALGAGLFLGEGIPRWLAIGAGVAFLGVLLIGIGTSFVSGDGRPVDPIGVLWCLAAALTYAIGVLAQKPMAGRLPASQITLIGAVIGAIACVPFAGQLASELGDASSGAWLGILYLGIVPTALAFTTWGYALGRMPAGQLGVTTYIVPPLVIIMGLIFFGEVPAPLAIVGGAVCLAGVALSRRKPRVPVAQENLPE
jgi:drug/metabolite transporter (DMT)-like permease